MVEGDRDVAVRGQIKFAGAEFGGGKVRREKKAHLEKQRKGIRRVILFPPKNESGKVLKKDQGRQEIRRWGESEIERRSSDTKKRKYLVEKRKRRKNPRGSDTENRGWLRGGKEILGGTIC